MSALRPCLEFCCSPNTVSRFIRIFPKAALFFLVLHVAIIIYTSMNTSKKEDLVAAIQGNKYIPKDPQHHRSFAEMEMTLRNTSFHRNKTKHFANLKEKDSVYGVNLP